MGEKKLCCGRRKTKISPSVSAPLHLILQTPRVASHEWRKGGGTYSRICQICHLSLDGGGLRCKDCGLCAHSHCGSSYPPLGGTVTASGPNSVVTGTTASLRSASVPPPFEPRIKRLNSTPAPPPTSIGSEQSHRLSTPSTPIQIIIDAAAETGTCERKLLETMRHTPGDPTSSSDDLQDPFRFTPNQIQSQPNSSNTSTLKETQGSKGHLTQKELRYVDGPLDGALYALVKPKGPSSADSGISVTVDQMKDLDRLLDALVEDAESIPDIPYHARQDSLPFSYGITDQNALRHNPTLHKPSSLTHQPQKYESKTEEWTGSRQEQSPLLSTPTNPTYMRSHSDDDRWGRGHGSGGNRPFVHQVQVDGRSSSLYSTPASTNERKHFYDSPPSESFGRKMYTSTPNSSYGEYGMGRSRGEISGQQRLRSSSADGRRTEDADAWLKRQMDRLHEKRLAKNQMKRNEWLEELKRTFPHDSRQQSQDGNEVFETNQSETVRPSSALRVYSRSTASTPAFFSSDDEDFDTEVETAYNEGPSSFYGSKGRGMSYGRKLERVHSDTAFDRMGRYNQPTPGNYSTIGSRSSGAGSDFQRTTPRFPTCPPTPYLNRPNSPAKPPRSPKSTHRNIQLTSSNPSTPPTNTATPVDGDWNSWRESPRAQTPLNLNPRPVFLVESNVNFARDLSSFWYKPNASREETICALRFQGPGAFLVRNSNSFPGAFGLAIKVEARGSPEEAVRHFLIEPTKYGVRLRGSAVEPVFSSLSALVYAHSVEPLALPTTLSLPSSDCVLPETQSESTTAHLLNQGAACQLLFLGLSGVECVSGEDAVGRGVRSLMGLQTPTVVSLRLAKQGLTLTDVFRQRFFRLHFPLAGISYAALDPERRTVTYEGVQRRIFGVVARTPTAEQNSCVVLAELEDGQPAQAIVSFFQRVIAWHAN